MATGTRRLALIAIVIAGSLLVLMPAAATAATRPITFDLFMDGTCINGRLSDNSPFKVVWRDAAGVLKYKEADHMAGPTGHWESCASPRRVLAVGDRIKVTVGTTVRVFVVPKLTLNADRATDVFKGKAPAGSTLQLRYREGKLATTMTSKTVHADSTGRWSYKKAGFNIMGGLYNEIVWTSAENDRIAVADVAPSLTVTLGGAVITGDAEPGADVKAKLFSATTMVRRATAVGAATAAGGFSVLLRDTAGNPVPVEAGNRLRALSVAADADWIVPGARVSANAATDVVTGRCKDAGTSDGLYWVRVIAPDDAYGRGQAIGYGDANGVFEIDFAGVDGSQWFQPADVQSGDILQLRCLQTTGDWVELRQQVP